GFSALERLRQLRAGSTSKQATIEEPSDADTEAEATEQQQQQQNRSGNVGGGQCKSSSGRKPTKGSSVFAAAKAKLSKPLTSDYDSNESPSGSELTIDESTATTTTSSSYHQQQQSKIAADKCFYLAKADSIGEGSSLAS